MARTTRITKPNPNQSSFGIWLTSYLCKHNKSILGFSNEVGITHRSIRDWVEGICFPNGGSVIMVCEVLAKYEDCFVDTIILEAMSQHPFYTMAIKRESKRYPSQTSDVIGV